MGIRLLALDLDGTLLGHDNTLRPVDAEAIARARAAGIEVTIATGRLASGTLPTARALGLTVPLVCGNGAVVLDAVTGAVRAQVSLDAALVEDLTHTLGRHSLPALWFTQDEIHAEEGVEGMLAYVQTWSPRVSLHPKLHGSPAWEHRHRVAMALGIGARASVDRVVDHLAAAHPGATQVAAFPAWKSELWTLLVRNAHVDKSTGLAQVATELGITAAEVAVVGDWINDVPMFRWAGRSFAMGQSPEEVARYATDRLRTTHHGGGGVAEAIGRILDDDGQAG